MIDIIDAQMELSSGGRDDLALLIQDKLDELERKDAAIAELVGALGELHDVVIDHNRSGADWKTSELFGRMMDALAKSDTLMKLNSDYLIAKHEPKQEGK